MSPGVLCFGFDDSLALAMRKAIPASHIEHCEILLEPGETAQKIVAAEQRQKRFEADKSIHVLYRGEFSAKAESGAAVSPLLLPEIARNLKAPLRGVIKLGASVSMPPQDDHPREFGSELLRFIPGELRAPTPGDFISKELSWRDVFWPDGFQIPLSRLSSSGLMLDKVERLAYDIFEACGLGVSKHLYEVHLTVGCLDKDQYERFRSLCGEIGLKCIQIDLPAGEFQRHTITGSFHRGTLEKVEADAHSLASTIRTRGFDVSRIKIETMMSNPLVPRTVEDAERMTPNQYFECHAKILVPPEGPPLSLRRICEQHAGHLSRNPSNRLEDGSMWTFVTQRFFRTDAATASARFSEMIQALRTEGFDVSNLMREYAVIDDNLALDENWIPHGPN